MSAFPSRAERRSLGIKAHKPPKGSPLRRLSYGEVRERGVPMPPWLEDVWMDDKVMVMTTTRQTEWGKVLHLIVRRHDLQPVRSWSTMQRVKNAVAGPDRTAVEVYPAEGELVDDANLYHLWVLPEGFDLPFGLSERR